MIRTVNSQKGIIAVSGYLLVGKDLEYLPHEWKYLLPRHLFLFTTKRFCIDDLEITKIRKALGPFLRVEIFRGILDCKNSQSVVPFFVLEEDAVELERVQDSRKP